MKNCIFGITVTILIVVLHSVSCVFFQGNRSNEMKLAEVDINDDGEKEIIFRRKEHDKTIFLTYARINNKLVSLDEVVNNGHKTTSYIVRDYLKYDINYDGKPELIFKTQEFSHKNYIGDETSFSVSIKIFNESGDKIFKAKLGGDFDQPNILEVDGIKNNMVLADFCGDEKLEIITTTAYKWGTFGLHIIWWDANLNEFTVKEMGGGRDDIMVPNLAHLPYIDIQPKQKITTTTRIGHGIAGHTLGLAVKIYDGNTYREIGVLDTGYKYGYKKTPEYLDESSNKGP